MTSSQKLAHMRTLVFAIALLILFVGLPILRAAFSQWPIGRIVSSVVLVVGGLAGMITALLSRPICPACEKKRAKFVFDKRDEYLVCTSCGHREKTGYDSGT